MTEEGREENCEQYRATLANENYSGPRVTKREVQAVERKWTTSKDSREDPSDKAIGREGGVSGDNPAKDQLDESRNAPLGGAAALQQLRTTDCSRG